MKSPPAHGRVSLFLFSLQYIHVVSPPPPHTHTQYCFECTSVNFNVFLYSFYLFFARTVYFMILNTFIMQLHKTVYLSTIVEEIFNVMKFHPKEYTFSSHIDELYCLHIIHMVWMFVLVLVELNVRKRNDNNNSNYVQILNQQGFARVRTIGRLGRMQIILL